MVHARIVVPSFRLQHHQKKSAAPTKQRVRQLMALCHTAVTGARSGQARPHNAYLIQAPLSGWVHTACMFGGQPQADSGERLENA